MTEGDVSRLFEKCWESLYAIRDFPLGDNFGFYATRTIMGTVDGYDVDVVVRRFSDDWRLVPPVRHVTVHFIDWSPKSTRLTCERVVELCHYAKSLLYPTSPAGRWRKFSRRTK